MLVRHEVAPTAITIATFVLTLVGAGVVALGKFSPAALIVGGLLVQVASVVDGCDGEVARAMLRTSPFGALLDTLLDRFADAVLLTALAVAAGADAKTLVLLGGALFFSMLVPYVKAAYEAASRVALPAARVTFGRDARMLAIAACAIALRPFVALVAVAVVSAAEAALRVARALRAARAPSDHALRYLRTEVRSAATNPAPSSQGSAGPPSVALCVRLSVRPRLLGLRRRNLPLAHDTSGYASSAAGDVTVSRRRASSGRCRP